MNHHSGPHRVSTLLMIITARGKSLKVFLQHPILSRDSFQEIIQRACELGFLSKTEPETRRLHWVQGVHLEVDPRRQEDGSGNEMGKEGMSTADM